MTSKCCWRGVLIIALGMALTAPANAQGFPEGKIGYGGPIAAPIVGAIATVEVVTVMIIHYSKKSAITGCVNSGGNGMTLTDEKTSTSTRCLVTRQESSRAIE